MNFPHDLPPDLSGAFRTVGLAWPDLRLGHYEGVLAELGDRPETQRLREHLRVLREAQRVFFAHLRDLDEEHGGSGMRLLRHRDRPCVSRVREKWAATAEQAAGLHTVATHLARRAVRDLRASGALPPIPDYLAGGSPAWLPPRPERGIRGEPTAGRGPAADALLRWREDPYGPRVCLVTGSAAMGKTRLLAWFSHSTLWHWSGYPDPSEAALCLAGLDDRAAARELARQLGRDGDPAGPALVTLADWHKSADPARMLAELIRPLTADPRVRLLLESPDRAGPDLPHEHYLLDLDDPRCTDRDAFASWYAAERDDASPFTAGQVYPSPARAAIATRATGADPGPALPLDERVTRAWLDGLSPAARAAVGTLSLTFAPIGPHTWRLLHCGRHPDDPETAAGAVAEAAARLPTAEPGLPAYAVPLPALAQAVAPTKEAHRELVAVIRGWPVSPELPPPAYVHDHLARHERLAGGPVEPLPVARPPGRVTRELLDGLYGPGGVVRLAPGEIHPAITHEPTRRFLSETGLPVNGVFEDDWTGDNLRCVRPMTAWWPEDVAELRECEGLPDDPGTLFLLDSMGTWFLLLDGTTGQVYEVSEALDRARVAHRDIGSYAYFTYVIHRERALWCGEDAHTDAAYWCAEDLSLELHTYEPQAMAGDEPHWPPTLTDYTLLT